MGYDNNTLRIPFVKLAARRDGDVQRALHTSSRSQYNIMTGARGKVNQLSKMKPVAFPFELIDRTQPAQAYGRTLWWWQGHPTAEIFEAGLEIGNYTTVDSCAWITNCGIKYLGFKSRADLLGAMDPINNRFREGDTGPLEENYSYVPPAGTPEEPLRASDLDNYKEDAQYNVIPDFGTESGTARVNVNNQLARTVKCSVMSAAVSNVNPSELSFDDLFGNLGAFALVCGLLTNDGFDPVSPSVVVSRNDEFVKELAIDLNDSRLFGRTMIAIYCASILVGEDVYYVPVMQSTDYCPNTPHPRTPKRKIYNSWYIDNSVPYYALTFTQKQNYGASFPFTSVMNMSSFQTAGAMNRWYLKLDMPQKTAAYQFGNNSFKIEFAGQFVDENGALALIYYTITSNSNPDATTFVLKNNEVTDQADWSPTETVIVTPGTGSQTCYLAIYGLFANAGGVTVTRGGTVWRIRLWFLDGQQEFSPEPDVEYGSLGNDHLNINVPAIE